jgi:hypothetical protein
MVDRNIKICRGINHPVTVKAAKVIMIVCDSIETLRRTAKFELLDFTACG